MYTDADGYVGGTFRPLTISFWVRVSLPLGKNCEVGRWCQDILRREAFFWARELLCLMCGVSAKDKFLR
jgi:hypothetical protein